METITVKPEWWDGASHERRNTAFKAVKKVYPDSQVMLSLLGLTVTFKTIGRNSLEDYERWITGEIEYACLGIDQLLMMED